MDVLPEILRSPERDLLRSSARSLLEDVLPDATVLALDRAGEFSRTAWTAMADADLLGLGVPERLAGAGGTVADCCLVTIELARRLPSLAVDYVLCGMAAKMLSVHGTPRQQEWLRDLTLGRTIFAYAMSEPGGGTDLLQLRTSAKSSKDEWVVNGQKQWISLAGEADLLFVLARTDPPQPGRSRAYGLSVLTVPREQPGVTTRRIRLEGMRAAGSYDVFFDNACATGEAMVGERGHGFFMLRSTLDVERVLSAAISLGIASAALEMTVRYAREREAFGGPIGRFQAIQHPVADSLTELTAAAVLVERAVQDIEAERRTASALSAMAKMASAEMAARVVDRGMRAFAALGLSAESRMQMFFRDARLALFSPVSDDMVRNMLAESLGLARSY